MIQLINKDFRDCEIPQGLVITDPPYNQGRLMLIMKDQQGKKKMVTSGSSLAKIKPAKAIECRNINVNAARQKL